MIKDDTISLIHLIIYFEPKSRMYELRAIGQAGVRVDGCNYLPDAVVRLGSGSCVRVGAQEFCVMLPQLPSGEPPPIRPLPALPGAGNSAPPTLPLVAIAVQALREAPGHVLSIGEIELWIRRAYPHVANTIVGARARKAWCAALELELRGRPAVCVSRDRLRTEHGAGHVWYLSSGVVVSLTHRRAPDAAG